MNPPCSGYPLGMASNNRLSNTAQYWGGRAKEALGRFSGNRRTQYEGKLDQAKANAKDAGLDVRNAFRRRRARY